MYYYGQNGYGYPSYGNMQSCPQFVGYTQGSGIGAAIWIVLFILLVIIIGAGWSFNGNNN